MNHLPNSILLYSRKARRWRIDIHRQLAPSGSLVVFLTGLVAPNFYRQRHMELFVFRRFTECVKHASDDLPKLIAQIKPKTVPAYPKARCIGQIQEAVFRIDLVLSRRLGGTLETMLAVYDTDGDTAPMLLATDGEIQQLCRDCENALSAVDDRPDESTNG